MYMPILKWRQGEYLALDRLDSKVKDKVLPLVEIPPIEWDFEKNKQAKTINEHLEPFARRLDKKWNNRKALIDLNLLDPEVSMNDGSHPVIYIFSNVRKLNNKTVPVTGLDRIKSFQQAIKKVVRYDKNGVCIRLKFKDIVKASVGTYIDSMVKEFNINYDDVDLVLDLEAPNYEPLQKFVRVIRNAIINLPQTKYARSFTIASTAFPSSMGAVRKSINIIERSEWLFYLEYLSQVEKGEAEPIFGDYVIAHPKLLTLDMRTVTPAASLRYTIDDAWYIDKGNSVREKGFGQYKKICKKLVMSKHFMGAHYSKADNHIKDCSEGKVSTGNLTVWRWVGTNHHITKVVNDCANFLYI